MIVLVCGGRKYSDYTRLDHVLAAVRDKHGVFCVLDGAAPGADSLASRWAKENGFPLMEMPANWDFYDKRAGPVRNQWMLDYGRPDAVVAFPGGNGTADMVRRATEAGIKVWVNP